MDNTLSLATKGTILLKLTVVVEGEWDDYCLGFLKLCRCCLRCERFGVEPDGFVALVLIQVTAGSCSWAPLC